MYISSDIEKAINKTMVNENMCPECKLELLSFLLATEVELPKNPIPVDMSEVSDDNVLPLPNIPIAI